ncbi:hypothetical protein N7457_006480 [Penicillium paradoxum]|uniref:uncharacterized protein n=1 Tax=Penicillium paradoxum TaxID=176176 RepID=UPI0025495067|nr:uncharacterized protein N7457_006480 [Penicillium paradoxum]KAJ5781320.1 hypothetical protein N7457_006480 [Penicillium paradoxum]
MPESSTKRSPQSNNQLLPNQKMRTTCNACQQAKIRCSHTHPCQRCESHGYQCIYSISQPLGRPAKKKTARPAAAGAGIHVRKGGGEVVDRSTRGNAGRASRPVPVARAQRARRVQSRLPSPSPKSGSVVSERAESHKSDSGNGTEATPAEQDSQWPTFTEWFSDFPEIDTAGGHTQDQEFFSTKEANTHTDPGFADASLDSSSERTDGFGCFGGPRCSGPFVNYSTQLYAPHIGLMADEPSIGGFDPLHVAVPVAQHGPSFQSGAIYPFSLAPNAIQISGTVQDPARIMELPSNDAWQQLLEPDLTSSSQSLLVEDIDLEKLPEDTSSLHCNCYVQAFSEVVRCEDLKSPTGILLRLERVQQQGMVTLQCPVCYASNARADTLTLLIMAIEKAARELNVRARVATFSVHGGVHSVWGAEDLDQMRRCLSHLLIIVRFISHDLERAAPSKWHLFIADETDRRLQSIIRIFE